MFFAHQYNLQRDDSYNQKNLSLDIINRIADELQDERQKKF